MGTANFLEVILNWSLVLLVIVLLLFFFPNFNILALIQRIITKVSDYRSKKLKEAQEAEARAQETENLINNYGNLSTREVVNVNKLSDAEKITLLMETQGLTYSEAHTVKEHWLKSAEEISLDATILYTDKILLLEKIHGYNFNQANEMIQIAQKEVERIRLKGIKRKISRKASQIYGETPVDDRQPIPDDVKTFVWQRDRGKCVKCGGNEKLEFDHIIPFSKGGSNTGRNLQLLCEKCNREKSNNI